MRLGHLFWRPDSFRAELRRLASVPATAIDGLPRELIADLDPNDAAQAEARIAQYLDDQGHELIGARTAAEIAEVLLSAAADARATQLPERVVDLIEDYLAITGPVGTVAARIGELARAHGIDIAQALDTFQQRLQRISAGGVAIDEADFSAEFGRNFEYYTGFVFEVLSHHLGPRSPLAGGGRYDRMLRLVGAKTDVPAVGAAIYSERVLLAVERGDA